VNRAMTILRFPSALALILAAACAQTPPGPPAPHSAMDVAASFGRTWDASIDQFAQRTLPIKAIERASGFIATDLLSLDSTFYPVADCGKDNDGGAFVPTNATFNVLVRGDSAHSTVRVTVRWISVGNSGGGVKSVICSTRGVWETRVENQIKESAERRR